MPREHIKSSNTSGLQPQDRELTKPNTTDLASAPTFTTASIIQLQRTVGNRATGQVLQQRVQRQNDLPPVAEGNTRNDGSGKQYTDFDGKQYRVSGREPNRKIEEVKRTETPQGDVQYVAMGVVVGFNANKPVVDYYPEPINLGDWYPQVTHVNGMNVKPESGIRDAVSLQNSVNETLDSDEEVALGQDAVDVLYTYSTTLGFGSDVWDCIKGKLSFSDDVTASQRQIMLDAVHNQQRTTVSAHSRGTIKTDNAVRQTHAALTQEYLPQVWEEAEQVLTLNRFQRFLVSSVIKDIAETRAKEEMDKYINLVYAGNAVEFPSTVLPVDYIVGSYDAISMLVGTYSEWGTKDWWVSGHDESTMTKVSGGHGYRDNYAATAGELIGQDILRHQ
jgi:hypothetical protein